MFKPFYPSLSLARSTVNQVFLPCLCKVITYSLHLQTLAKHGLALVRRSYHHTQPGAMSWSLADCKHGWGTPVYCKANFIPPWTDDTKGSETGDCPAWPTLGFSSGHLVEGSWGCTAVLWIVLIYPSDTGHRNSTTEGFRHNCLKYLCGLLQILSKLCDPRWQ